MREGRRLSSRDLVVIVAPKRVLEPASDPKGTPESGDSIKNRFESDDLGMGLGSRLGITASRKVGNAVCRNRFKRRVRTWFRERRGELDRDIDLVVIARKSGGQLGWAELDERLSKLLGLSRSSG